MVVCYVHFPMTTTIRVRGGGDADTSKYHELPALKQRNFLWDGLPCIDFQERVMYPFKNALGGVWVKGQASSATLLDTIEQTDPGGVRGNPPRAAAPGDVVDDSNARNKKAFHSTLNYVLSSSEFYLMVVREYSVNS